MIYIIDKYVFILPISHISIYMYLRDTVLVSVNPWFTIPLAVTYAALKAVGVTVTTATIKAASILIAAGKSVTAATVNAVVSSWPIIETALRRAGIAVGWWAVGAATWNWVQGNCIVNGSRTPDGHFGDLFCSSCARRFGQLFVLMVAGLLVTPMMLISMDLGQILLFLVVLGLLSTLVLIIPMDFGQKTGLWIIKKRFPSWSEGKIGELSSFWGMGALTVTVIGVWAEYGRLN